MLASWILELINSHHQQVITLGEWIKGLLPSSRLPENLNGEEFVEFQAQVIVRLLVIPNPSIIFDHDFLLGAAMAIINTVDLSAILRPIRSN